MPDIEPGNTSAPLQKIEAPAVGGASQGDGGGGCGDMGRDLGHGVEGVESNRIELNRIELNRIELTIDRHRSGTDSRTDLGSIWDRSGIDLVSIWDRSGIDLAWDRYGIDLGLIWDRSGIDTG